MGIYGPALNPKRWKFGWLACRAAEWREKEDVGPALGTTYPRVTPYHHLLLRYAATLTPFRCGGGNNGSLDPSTYRYQELWFLKCISGFTYGVILGIHVSFPERYPSSLKIMGVSPIGSLPFRYSHFPLNHDSGRKSKSQKTLSWSDLPDS